MSVSVTHPPRANRTGRIRHLVPASRRPAGTETPVVDPRERVVVVLYPAAQGPEDGLRSLIDQLNAAGIRVAAPDLPIAPPPPATKVAPPLLAVDTRSRTVARDGVEIALTRLEFDLLRYLVERPRQVFSRGQLLAAVWGHTFTGTRTVDVHIRRLRQKLGVEPLIVTVRGVGYRVAADAPVTLVTDKGR